jgi:hypothetical protein
MRTCARRPARRSANPTSRHPLLDETVAALPLRRGNDFPDARPEDTAVKADRRVQIRGYERNVVKTTPRRDNFVVVNALRSHDHLLSLDTPLCITIVGYWYAPPATGVVWVLLRV